MPTTNALPVHPLAGPTVNPDGTITVSAMLRSPTRLNDNLLAWLDHLAAANPDLVPLFYRTGGAVSGGAVIYTQFIPGQDGASPQRFAEQIAPAAEYPLVTALYGQELVAGVNKYGGKFFITDEARDRNDQSSLTGHVQTLALTIRMKVNQAALVEVDKALVAAGQVVTDPLDWSGYNPITDPPANSPMGDLLAIQANASAEGVPYVYDTLVLNPLDALQWQMSFYALPSLPGMPSIVQTNSMPQGTGLYVDKGALGGMRLEAPLRTVTFREEETDRTWTQSGLRPLFYVDQPTAGVKFSIAPATP